MKKQFLVTQITVAVLVLATCVSPSVFAKPPVLMSPNKFTQSYEPLDKDAINSLSEIGLLRSPLLKSSILKVGYIPEDNIAVAIYDEERTVVGWSIDTNSIIFNHDLGIVTSKGLVFTESGKNLIGATEHVFEDGSEYINGIALWDVQTGELIRCITYPCQDNNIPRDGFLGLAVNARADRLAIYSKYVIDLTSISGDFPGLVYTINSEDASYFWLIGSVAFDERYRRYAVVFQEGRVYIFDNERSMHHRIISNGEQGDRVSVTYAQIDPTGHWLAFVRGEKTQLMNLDSGKLHLEINGSNPIIAFDKTGQLLFIGIGNKLSVYSV